MGSLPEGEGAVAKSQRGMTQRMRRTTAGHINRKGKYKHLVWCNLIYVEKKTERSVLFPLLVPFMIHETNCTHDFKVTVNTRAIRWRWRVNYIYELYC